MTASHRTAVAALALASLLPALAAVRAGAAPPASDRTVLRFYWAVNCPHCEEAKPFVDALEREFPDLAVRRLEIRGDAAARDRFLAEMRELGVTAPGVPTFVFAGTAVVGFRPGATEEELRRLIAGRLSGTTLPPAAAGRVILPLFGEVDPEALPFPAFTVMIGLLDGLNPCAMWVLLVMLGVLLRVRSRLRLALFGATFVLMSGAVYFLFMTAWTAVFSVTGASRGLTRALGVALLAVGAINLKELVWFGQGVSLMIPERAKPGLYRRMRAIAAATSLPAALVGIAALAFVVNLVELGCTIGLPAVYTRLLTLRPDLTPLARYAYLALYNAAYIVPLGLVLVAYGLTLHRFALGERGARVLKALSGTLLVAFGLLFLLRPEVLAG